MMVDSPDASPLDRTVAALEARVVRMERQRRFAAVALGAVLLVAGVLACGGGDGAADDADPAAGAAAGGRQDASFFELSVNRLLVRDRDGEVAAKLTTSPERGVLLTLYGAPDVPAMELHAGRNFSNIRMYNGGSQRFEVHTDSAASTARLSLMDMQQRPVLQGTHESGMTAFYLMGDPSDRGLRPNIGFTMPPGSNLPFLSTRNQEAETEAWGLGD